MHGVIAAARRKLEQELGIDPDSVPASSFSFVVRVHYQSPCDQQWGEHEIDYILICQPPDDVQVKENANEVAESRYFSADELRSWVESNRNSSESAELISPWFQIVHDNFLYEWWNNLGNLDKIESWEIFRGPGAEARREGQEN